MRTAIRDDRGIAGVVGLIVLFAAIVTIYTTAARTDLPQYGRAAEESWDTGLTEASRKLAESMADSAMAKAPLTVVFPTPPKPETVDIPLIGSLQPARPSGTISFNPTCTNMSANHTRIGAGIIQDFNGYARGCIELSLDYSYSRASRYVAEFGGVLRVQGDGAVVIQGPPLDLNKTTQGTYKVGLTLVGLRGAAASASLGTVGARVDLGPLATSHERPDVVNAAEATWVLESRYPAAWKTWFEDRLDLAGWVPSRAAPAAGQSSADYRVTCVPATCVAPVGGLGKVIVTFTGPRTDVDDLQLAITYGRLNVGLR